MAADQLNASGGGAPDMKMMFAMVSTPPPWLTQDYFEKALQSYEQDNALKITEYAIAPATKPGENFCSIVFRAKCTYTSRGQSKKDVSFIVKVEPFIPGARKDMLGENRLFETEVAMYTKTLPEMQRLLKNVDDDEVFAPDFVFASLDPKIIVIKDLTPDQYAIIPDALEEENFALVLKKLGKFHGLSYYINGEHGGVDEYKDGFISRDKMNMMPMLQHTFNSVADGILAWGDKMVPIAEKLKAMQPHFAEKLFQIYTANSPSHGYKVLNHGDFHLKNLLFRSGDNPKVVEAIRLIDYQLCIHATPMIDLTIALYAIGGAEARKNREKLIKVYHDEFAATLSKLGFLKKIPSLLDLNIEMMRHGFLEVYVGTCLMPMFFIDQAKLAGMLEVTEMSPEVMLKIRDLCFKDENLKADLSKALVAFNYKGFLDI